jgi:hypothetical protein
MGPESSLPAPDDALQIICLSDSYWFDSRSGNVYIASGIPKCYYHPPRVPSKVNILLINAGRIWSPVNIISETDFLNCASTPLTASSEVDLFAIDAGPNWLLPNVTPTVDPQERLGIPQTLPSFEADVPLMPA